MNNEQVQKSESLLGKDTVEMLLQVHKDALWILENLGIACHHPELVRIFQPAEAEGRVMIHENRLYLTAELVERCLETVPGVADFFVPRNSFLIGGTAPYVYDDKFGKPGLLPSAGHVIRIAKAAEKNRKIAGISRGVSLRSRILQMDLMAEYCSKPLCIPVTSDAELARAKELHRRRKNIMAVFCLTRPPLMAAENLAEPFIKTVQAGLPVFLLAKPLAGVSAPYCYNGVLALVHAEALFGICAAQQIREGAVCIHGGHPLIADPCCEYSPNHGLISHNLLNLLMAHLNLMLDIPTCQTGGTTHEVHVTEKAISDVRVGQALFLKYGFHMVRHSFGFLRYLFDFSFDKLEKAIEIAKDVTPEDAPDVRMPVYDERGMDSVRRCGLAMYTEDPLTTANLGKIFTS